MTATARRKSGGRPDPLIGAAEAASRLSDLIARWKAHIDATDPHPFRSCGECKRLYEKIHKAHGQLGYRVLDRVQLVPRKCGREGCSNDFTPANGWQRFCSQRCRQVAYERRKSGGGGL